MAEEWSETFILTPSRTQTLPFVFNSPHSGDEFPDDFLERSQLERPSLRKASDLFVDRLIAPLSKHGATVMKARLPRSYIDLNREPFELDPRLIEGPLPPEANTRSLRVMGGLGTVPRVIGDQIEIYAGKLTLQAALERIERAYLPYHRRLGQVMAQSHAQCGRAILIDCHSMPSTIGPRPSRLLPDIVLGDRYGTSCAPYLIDTLEAIFRQNGFKVERNQPYAGGYITEHYGRVSTGWHALQVEINRALYMDERTLLPNEGFVPMMKALEQVFGELIECEPYKKRKSDLHFYQRAAE